MTRTIRWWKQHEFTAAELRDLADYLEAHPGYVLNVWGDDSFIEAPGEEGCVYTWPLGGVCGRVDCSPSRHCKRCGHFSAAHVDARCRAMLQSRSYAPCYCKGWEPRESEQGGDADTI